MKHTKQSVTRLNYCQYLLSIEETLKKVYYCPLKDNRQVNDLGDAQPYGRVDALKWSEEEKQRGKIVKIKGFPKDHKVKMSPYFRLTSKP
jgi:hypothetical protein